MGTLNMHSDERIELIAHHHDGALWFSAADSDGEAVAYFVPLKYHDRLFRAVDAFNEAMRMPLRDNDGMFIAGSGVDILDTLDERT